jgi:hypothetical protein
MEQNSMMYRQGDVLLQRIEKLPKGVQKQIERENGLLILAKGEATGHHHSISSRNALLVLIGTEMFLRCLKKETLKHQEHGPVPLPPGDYKVQRQKEYSPEAIRNVAD